MHAELTAVICSGPMGGRQRTYAAGSASRMAIPDHYEKSRSGAGPRVEKYRHSSSASAASPSKQRQATEQAAKRDMPISSVRLYRQS